MGADLAPRSASSTSRALTDDARESAARCRSESAPRLLERGLKFVPHACRHMIVDAAHTRNLVAHPFRLQDFRDAVLVHLCLVAPRAAHRPGGLSTRRRSAAARPAPRLQTQVQPRLGRRRGRRRPSACGRHGAVCCCSFSSKRPFRVVRHTDHTARTPPPRRRTRPSRCPTRSSLIRP